MGGFTESQQAFIDWLRVSQPKLYKLAMTKARKVSGMQSLAGLGDMDWGGIFNTIADTVAKAAPAVLQLRQQRDLMKIQLQRAKAGQAPISPEQYAQYATPATAVSVEAPYSSYNVQPYAGGMPTSKIVTYAGLALLGFGALWLAMRKR